MKLGYGNAAVDVNLPEHIEWRVLKKDAPFSLLSEKEITRQGVASLIEQLQTHISHHAKVLLIVPDHTRKCNLPIILPELKEALQRNFAASIEILIANGSHALQPESTIIDLVSEKIYNAIPVYQHDARDDAQLAFFGATSHGTAVWLNKKIKEADFVITVNGILFHYFAGFGGGPKMLLPGVAGYETIRRNHSRSIDKNAGHFHPQAREGLIDGNPVYDDLAEALKFVPNVLSLQVVLSPQQQIACCEAGPIMETQRALIPHVKELYSVGMDKEADVVIASAGGFPSDVNLVQVHKSIHHAFQAVKENGILVIFAQCREGIGSATFLPYFEYGTAQKIGEALMHDFKINGQTALSLKEKAEKAGIILISELETAIVQQTGMTPARSWREAMDIISGDLQKCKTGFIVPQAGITIPLKQG